MDGSSELKIKTENCNQKSKRHQCDECDLSFKAKTSLCFHKFMTHKSLKIKSEQTKLMSKICNSSEKADKKFECKDCNRNFTTNSNLKKHIATIHQKVRNFKCDICNKTFTNRTNLKVHKSINHIKSRDFICNICNADFTLKTYLKRHCEQKKRIINVIFVAKVSNQWTI